MKRSIGATLTLLALLAVTMIIPQTATAQESPPFYCEFINVDIDAQENGGMLVPEIQQKYVFTATHTNERYRWIPLDKVDRIDNVEAIRGKEKVPATKGIENYQQKQGGREYWLGWLIAGGLLLFAFLLIIWIGPSAIYWGRYKRKHGHFPRREDVPKWVWIFGLWGFAAKLHSRADRYFPQEGHLSDYYKKTDSKMKKFSRAVIFFLIWVVSSFLCVMVVWLLPIESAAVRVGVAIFVFLGSMFLGERLLISRL